MNPWIMFRTDFVTICGLMLERFNLYLRHLQNTDERIIPELPLTVLTVFQKNSQFLSTVNIVTILPDALGK